MKRTLPSALVFFFLSAAVFGQSAKEMDSLLADEAVSFARAARYVLPAAGASPENVKESDAFRFALEKGWVPEGASPDTPIRLDQFAFLVVEAFSMKGGALYSIFPRPRYAYRDLIFKEYIQGRSDPAQKLSGNRLVLILGRVLDAREATP